MKICLIIPPNPTALEDRIEPHLGLLCIAAAAREQGHEVQYLEWDNQRPPSADVYGLTAYGVNYHLAANIAAWCKLCYPDSKTIVGGPIASALPQHCLNNFDAVCIGEGEAAFLEFLDKQETGRFYFGRYTSYVDGSSPPPAYDLVDWSLYTRIVMGHKTFAVMASRGYPFNCAFCHNDRAWDRFRLQPIDAVARDIRFGKQVTGYDAVNFWDSSFELTAKSQPLLDEIEDTGVIFFYQARGSVHGRDKAIYKAGGRVAFIGVESGDPDILKRMNKGLTLDEMREAIFSAQEAGISVRCGLIFGFPGETLMTLETTRKFVEEIKPDQVFISYFAPFPGSDVWLNPAKYGVTWMAPWTQQQLQGKEGWVEASIETPWMSREDWNREAKQMTQWWRSLPRKKEADPSWQRLIDEG